jgi:hypothetical protein
MDTTANTEKLSGSSTMSLFWVVANIFSIFGGVLFGKFLYDFLYPFFYPYQNPPGLHIFSLVDDSVRRMVFIGLSIGILSGLLERLVLQRYKLQWNGWILANILGWGFGFAAAESLEMFGWQWGTPQLLGGIIIGFSQWIVLKQYLAKSYWWIIACVIGSFAILSWIPVGYTFLMILEEYSIPIIVAGLIMGIFTGATLSWLLTLSWLQEN